MRAESPQANAQGQSPPGRNRAGSRADLKRGMHPGVAPHPASYCLPPGVDSYWAYHAQVQAAYAPPPYPYAGHYAGPYAGMAPPQAPWSGYGPGLKQQGGAGRMAGGGHGAGGSGMAEVVDEIANGGNGLSSLGKMLGIMFAVGTLALYGLQRWSQARTDTDD